MSTHAEKIKAREVVAKDEIATTRRLLEQGGHKIMTLALAIDEDGVTFWTSNSPSLSDKDRAAAANALREIARRYEA